MPQILVVGLASDYSQVVVTGLESFSIRATITMSVDEFLDLNCQKRFQLVLLEIDALNPGSLDNIKLLRTHFGEGPATRIIVSSRSMSSTILILAEQCGADICMTKPRQPEAMVAALKAEIEKQMRSNKPSLGTKTGHIP